MKVETERLENCQVALTIEIDEERTQRALRSAARRISRQAKIPGFRPGKAPYNVVARMFGKEVLYQEVVDELGNTIYEEALEQTGLEPFGQATLNDYEIEPLVLQMVVPIAPVVELGDYRQMRLKPAEGPVSEEEINEALREIQEQNTFWEPITRPAKRGDLAIVDIEGTVKGEIVVEKKREELILEAGSSDVLADMDLELLDMSVNEQKEFTLTYPEDHEDRYLAGQQVQFKVHLRDLKEAVMPDIDDDLARTVGDYDTLEELKAQLRRDLQAQAEEDFADQALAALIEGSEIEFPPMMLERETDEWLDEFNRRLRRQGLNLKNYLEMRKLSEEEFRNEISPQIEERIERFLVLGRFMELEGLDKSEAGVDEAMERLAAIARGELEEEEEKPLPDEQLSSEEETEESTDQQAEEHD